MFLSLIFKDLSAQVRKLDYFINEAVANSPLLKDLQNQVRLNQLDSMLIAAAQRPQVSFTSNDSYAPVIKGYGYDEIITNIANVNALFSVSKSLLNGLSNKTQFANLVFLSNALRNNASISEQDVRRSIISQYITTYGDQLQVNFSSEIQDMLRKQDIILKKLTEKNVYKQVDYLAFYVTVQQNEFKLKQQVNQFKNDYATLNYLAGISDTSQPVLQSPEISVSVSTDINSSVFFKKYYIDSLTLANNKRIIDLTYRPKLSVSADAGYNSSLTYLPYKNFGTSIALNLIIPIYDGKQKQLQYNKIDVQENTLLANKKFFTRQYYQQQVQLRQQLKSTSDLINDINLQLKYIETLITVNEKLLQTGEVRIYDYILSLNNFLNAKNLINENTVARLQLINQINYWNR
ncbi:MAG: TolC family protein [Ferruginibacter sp.]